ncbi:diaminopimelate epimerase [bacterium]|nr:diaminopimelate epimerase [bacterium]|tara:strand:+ start:451 stop:1293 length:843 start_codon:yes stop_codon:yes gene_type:complete
MKQTYHFSKYHGLGNDFIIFDGLNQRINIDHIQGIASALCDRHYGIGADGIIIVLESSLCDSRMTIFNSDGSSPEMCGNGLRCFASFCYEHKLIETDVFSVETDAGKMVPALILKEGVVVGVEIDMGIPQSDISFMTKNEIIHSLPISIKGVSYDAYIVSMGNPHLVIFLDSHNHQSLDEIAEEVYANPLFKSGINIELVDVISRQLGKMVVWERGVGKTLACGTGACAATVAGVYSDQFERKVTIEQPGGNVFIEWQESDNHVIKTGPAKHVYDGHVML